MDQVVQIRVDELQANPLQPRGIITPESLVDLIDSIKEHGILEPLVIAKTPAGYQIIAGERRWRAAKLGGQATVPAIIKETTPQGMLEMAIVENVQRTDLNALDRARAFERLMQEFSLTTTEISQKIGKSPAYVSNTMRLLQLPDALKDGLLTGLISEGHARALAAISDVKLMIDAYKIVLRESGSVRRAEDLARRMQAQLGQKARVTHLAPQIVAEEIDQMRQQLEDSLGGKSAGTQVKLTRSRAETKILIVFKGNLEDTDPKLQKLFRAITSST